MEEGPQIDAFFRRSKDQTLIHPIEDDKVFSLNEAEHRLLSTQPAPSAVLPSLPAEAISIAHITGERGGGVQLEGEKCKWFKEEEEGITQEGQESKVEENDTMNQNKITITRSGRISRPPNKLNI